VVYNRSDMLPAQNDQLTIVLTLKDRSAFTFRWMRYMNDQRCPYPILIADGGADQAVQADLEQPGRYPHLRYTYVRFPFDRDYATYYRKFADAVDLVTTPYVLLADNDDFVLFDPLPQCLKFLSTHDAFVACGGKRIVLRLLRPDGEYSDQPTSRQYHAIADDRPPSLVGDTGVERVCTFLAGARRQAWWNSWHHVLRTAAVQRGAAAVRSQNFHDPVTFEIHMHLHWLLTGNYMSLDLPFLVKHEGGAQLTVALNAEGSVFERFVVSNAFGELRSSLGLWEPALSTADRARIEHALVQWIAREAHALAPQARHAGAPALARARQRVAGLVGRVWRRFRTVPQPHSAARPSIKLPSLEPYLLD
jgi:glycosyltransferase domain-containing protein